MDSTRTQAETVAGIIESAAAWWQLASRELAAGNLETAERYAHLGTEGMRERIGRIAEGDAPTPAVDSRQTATRTKKQSSQRRD
jgi:hypothetical protein